MAKTSNQSVETLLAQMHHALDMHTGAVVPNIQTATTFARDDAYNLREGMIYARNGNSNFNDVETIMARLEGGTESQLFASGLAAFAAIIQSLKPGAHVVAPKGMYYAALTWLNQLAERGTITLSIFDPAEDNSLQAAIKPGQTELVWIETALNPTWQVLDITSCAKLAHNAGAILAVDATVTPPVTCRPIALGADLVFHSATKYLNGHSDILGGIITTAKSNDRWTHIKQIRTLTGGVIGPFEAWLLLRGMRTLALRYERASSNAQALAEHFSNHPKLEVVLYPGLPTHPGHEIAASQCTKGFGGMMSILVKGGFDEALEVTKRLKLFLPATSLGGVESLAEHRKTIEGDATDVPANLIRLSVGIEAIDELIEDLDQALTAI